MGLVRKKTKIVATIGPACREPRVLRPMIEAGLNVARLNLSHGTPSDHREMVQHVRAEAEALGRSVAIMADTPGQAMRTGALNREKIRLQAGQEIVLTDRSILGDESQLYVNKPGFARYVRPGMEVLLANGEILLDVEATSDTDVRCRIRNSGELGERKRVNIPEAQFPSLDGDEASIRFAAELGVDFLAASFVQEASDIAEIRTILGEGSPIEVIAKIETREAVRNLDGLIAAADGLMVARGDLGVELPLEEVPLVQKEIVLKCNRNGVPVIIATQMLKSMTENPTPTRAEVTDVANAILDGTDAIMLSEETAIGCDPVRVVEVMCQIAQRIEQDPHVYHHYGFEHASVTEAIGESACQIADRIEAAAIIPSTTSGSTAKLVAKFRPRTPILAVTYSERALHRLALVWGVEPIRIEFTEETEAMLSRSIEAVAQVIDLPAGTPVVLTAGVPFGVPGTTNLIKVERV